MNGSLKSGFKLITFVVFILILTCETIYLRYKGCSIWLCLKFTWDTLVDTIIVTAKRRLLLHYMKIMYLSQLSLLLLWGSNDNNKCDRFILLSTNNICNCDPLWLIYWWIFIIVTLILITMVLMERI